MARNKDMCEICGKYPARFVAIIEGATLRVCGTCARSGEIIEDLGRFGNDKEGNDSNYGGHSYSTKTFKRRVKMADDIIADYSKIVKRKRQELKLPVSVVAERINEKESYLHGIENRSVKPSIQTAKKLEKLLGVDLVEKVEMESSIIPTNKKNEKKKNEPTLGDYLSK